jgi:hypothetical protein
MRAAMVIHAELRIPHFDHRSPWTLSRRMNLKERSYEKVAD